LDPDPEILFLLVNSSNIFTIASVLVLFLLLVSSALISGAEVAFFSLSQTDLNELSENGKKENIVVTLLEKPRKLLATILITNNFINILIVLLFASLSETLFSEFNFSLNLYFFTVPVRFLLEIVLVTFLILHLPVLSIL
jgi:Mg2+/Co2+ transporter CorB